MSAAHQPRSGRSTATTGPGLHLVLLALTVGTTSLGAAQEPTSLQPATGQVRFLRFDPPLRPTSAQAAAALDPAALSGNPHPATASAAGPTATSLAKALLTEVADRFGADPNDLVATGEARDTFGFTHVHFAQLHAEIPVWAAAIKVHFDRSGALTAVNGVAIPLADDLDPTPVATAAAATRTARRTLAARLRQPPEPSAVVASAATSLAIVAGAHGATSASAPIASLVTGSEPLAPITRLGPPSLTWYHSGLARGVPGTVHLAWRIELAFRATRWLAFVDSQGGPSGKLIDLLPATSTALDREVFLAGTASANRVWREGDPLPFGGSGDALTDLEANTAIHASAGVYDLFRRLSGGSQLSWDGNSAPLQTVLAAPGLDCPNANWNGQTANFCRGTASDDVVAHELVHGYSEATHGLLYQWQPGALNEAYSDIFGELVDQLDGHGLDAPGEPRADEGCSAYGGPGSPTVTVLEPATLAGLYSGGRAQFGASLSLPVSGLVALARDVADELGPATTDACSPLTNASEIAGRIALVDRGTCTFVTKTRNVEAAGGLAVIVVNNAGNGLVTMGGDATDVTIPAIFLAQDDGARLREVIAPSDPEEAPQPLRVTVGVTTIGGQSLRWIVGEEAPAFPDALRDLWNPTCFANAGRVGDPRYTCGPGTAGNDFGGVHWNSGIVARAFAALVDGGRYNGRDIASIGATKAAALWWRAMAVYQTPTSDFADHADALEQACVDLVASGTELPRLDADGGSGEHLTSDDCAALAAAIAAAELRGTPAHCAFLPILTANAPPQCSAGTPVALWSESFETGAADWRRSDHGVYAEYQPRSWSLVNRLPDQRPGTAFFADNPVQRGDCRAGSDDQSGVVYLESPAIAIPTDLSEGLRGSLALTFDHYIATEAQRDGGVLEWSKNGAAWEVVPATAYLFNRPNATVATTPVNSNPLAGKLAWTGTNDGSLGGSWGTTRVDLGSFVDPGDTVRLRFALGSDGCVGRQGWYVDDITVYQCQASPSCTPDDTTLCLLGGRFAARATWRNQYSATSGTAKALPFADFTGFFAFDDPANIELVVKLLDFGEAGASRVRVFYGQLTDLAFDLAISSTTGGGTKTYTNTPGQCGGIDQDGFATANRHPLATAPVDLGGVVHGLPRVETSGWRVAASLPVRAPKAAPAGTAATGSCVPTPDTLCLLDRRFAVRVDWRNQFDGAAGAGSASSLSDLSGLFTFADPRNVELLIKLLDFGDRVLVLYGSLTDLEHTISVHDTVSNRSQLYRNPPGRYCGGIDDAF